MTKLFRPLFILLFLIFPLGQLGRISLGEGVVLQLNDLAVGVVILTWLASSLIKRRKFLFPPLSNFIFVFFLVGFLSLLVNLTSFAPQELLIGSLYLWRWAAYAGIYFLVFNFLTESKKRREKNSHFLIFGLLGAGTAVGMLGLLQYFLYPNLGNLAYLGWDPHYLRLFSTFFDPGFTGAILVLTLILGVVLLLEGISKPRWWLILALGINYLALALTYSRSSLLMFFVAQTVVALAKRSPKFFLGITLLLAATIFLLPRPTYHTAISLERKESTSARLASWQNAWEIFRERPILGVGFNTYRYAQQKQGFLKEDWQSTHAGAGSDSSLLLVLVTTGIIGFVIFLGFLGKILITSFPLGSLNLILFSSLVSLLSHSLFLNSLFYPWIMEWFFIILGVSMVWRRLR